MKEERRARVCTGDSRLASREISRERDWRKKKKKKKKKRKEKYAENGVGKRGGLRTREKNSWVGGSGGGKPVSPHYTE